MKSNLRQKFLFIQRSWKNDSTFHSETYLNYSLISILIYSVWAFFYPLVDPRFKDGFLERLLVTGAFGIPVFVACLLKQRNRTIEFCFIFLLTGGALHHHVLTLRNGLHPIYIAGTILAVTAVQLMVPSFRSFLFFFLSNLLFVAVVLYKSQDPLAIFWLLAELTISAYSATFLFIRLYQSERILEQYEDLFVANKELEIRNKQLIQAGKMAALGEMASGIAHEINNPLSVITGNSTLLKKKIEKGEIDPSDFSHRLNKIEQTSHRLAKIVNGLRTFSRNGEHDPFIISEFGYLLEESLDLSSERFLANDTRLIIDPIPKVKISCRATQISQVFINLFNNALDATAHLLERWVKISFQQTEDSIIIFVSDSGKGVDPDILDKIFEPFFTSKETGKGTGLGLSLSKKIIEMHNGELVLDNTALNTTFIVTLPLAKNDEI